MKFFFAVFTFLVCSFFLKAQSFWAQGIGGDDVDEAMDVCSDNSGNIISAGYFTNTAAFGTATTLTSASSAIPDIYVSKSNSSGVVQWAVRAGGIGSDRALSVKTDATGNIYITGFYYGAATFGSTILTSVNGSQDIFIAKLNSSGIFIWAVSAGGSMADIGNAIDVDANGNVVVTGQFQGNASFGTSILTSMTDPLLNKPSLDIFTAKYDSNGNFLWVRQGKAKYTDRGLDIAADASGNIYVCGQFSDTILFNQVHNNQVMNAAFLIKYDANGNEIWFRMASGTYSIAYSIVLDGNQDIYMTGDYQGNLAFYGPPNNYLSDKYPKCVFTVKYLKTGLFVWAQSESSNNYISSRSIALDHNGDVYIAGEFGCTLNEYADIFGQGTFNSIGYQDIFTVKYNSVAGLRKWMRNFGGPGNDKAHGIVVNTIDNPVIAGSYEKRILWPVTALTITSNNYLTYSAVSGNASYCNDNSYGIYNGIRCAGFSDGFVASAVDITREPYDYYHRTGTSCIRDFVKGCVDSGSYSFPYSPAHKLWSTCPDTMRFCMEGHLFANTNTGSGTMDTTREHYYDYYSIGPGYNYKWSSSAFGTTSYIDTINTTNYYSVKMTTVDGCYTSEDSVYAIVNPIPQPPTITDDHGVNSNQPQCGQLINFCLDTILLSAGNINGNSVSWYLGGGMQNTFYSPCYLGGTLLTNNDSLTVTSSGYYNAVVTNQYGCQNSNSVPVKVDSFPINIVPKSLIPDTIIACYGDQVSLNLYDSLTGKSCFHDLTNNWSSNGPISIGSPSCSYWDGLLGGIFIAQTSGTFIVSDNIAISNKCGTKTFFIQDTFYLLVHPLPVVVTSGNQTVCTGQPTTISASGGTSYLWYPGGDTSSSIVVAPAVTTTYSVWVTNIFGCKNTGQVTVSVFPNPVISTVPYTGLICPNDSVLIYCNTAGTNYQWIGPNGILPFNTQSIYQSTPGFYHCIVTNASGCVLTTNTVELKQYNTPYLLPTPSAIVCLGETVTLQVITNDTTLIQWAPPLSGGGTMQVVNQSGVYSCSVTMCGITTVCTLTVVVSQATAQISGAGKICPGDSVLLTANSGMFGYQWLPISSQNDSVYVHAGGTYSLTTIDANGCTADTSFTVIADTSVAKPSVSDTIICAGNSVTLFASGSSQIDWYSSLASGNPVYSGNPFTTPIITSQTTYYAAAYDSTGCHSFRDSVTVMVDSASLVPIISVTSPVCIGDSIFLNTSYLTNVIYSWTGPNGFSSSQQNAVIPNATGVNAGTYTLVISGANCTSPAVTDTVSVILSVPPVLNGKDSLCEGDTLVISIANPVSNTTYYWNGPNGFSSTGNPITIFPSDTSHTGIYTAYGVISGCTSAIDSFIVVVKPLAQTAVVSSNSPVCTGDTIFLFASAGAGTNYSWIGPSGFSSSVQNPVLTPSDSSYAGTYTVSTTLNGCSGNISSVSVAVNPLPVLYLGPDTTICIHQPWLLIPSGNYSGYLWYDNSTAASHLIDSTGDFYLTVTNQYGCKASDTIRVNQINCDPRAPDIFTPNGDGVNDFFSFSGNYFKELSCEIFDRWGMKVYEWNDTDGKWDGTDMNTKQPVVNGTYYYVARIVRHDGKKAANLAGYVTVVR